MEFNEEELVDSVIEGSKAAIEALFNKYVNNSVKLAYLITGDWSSAEDAVQEAFIRAFANIKAFDRNRSFKPWFTKIVVNEARRARKSTSKYFDIEAILGRKSEDQLIEDKVIEKLHKQELLDKINKLHLNYRLPIILMYFSGLSEKEIGDVLGLPTTTIKTRLYRGRQKLKSDIESLEVNFQYEK